MNHRKSSSAAGNVQISLITDIAENVNWYQLKFVTQKWIHSGKLVFRVFRSCRVTNRLLKAYSCSLITQRVSIKSIASIHDKLMTVIGEKLSKRHLIEVMPAPALQTIQLLRQCSQEWKIFWVFDVQIFGRTIFLFICI